MASFTTTIVHQISSSLRSDNTHSPFMGHRLRRMVVGIDLVALSAAILWFILSRLFIVVVVSFWGLVVLILIVLVVIFLIIDYIFDIL